MGPFGWVCKSLRHEVAGHGVRGAELWADPLWKLCEPLMQPIKADTMCPRRMAHSGIAAGGDHLQCRLVVLHDVYPNPSLKDRFP